MHRQGLAAAFAVAGVAAAMMAGATPAYANGTQSGTVCGAYGEFKTVGGIRQTSYIVSSDGQASAADNGGCYGIVPSGRIWWTPRANPKWRQMPGNGVAETTNASRLVCSSPSYQMVEVRTAAGTYYRQVWIASDHSWSGSWINRKNFACA